jgi:hypothetical protein
VNEKLSEFFKREEVHSLGMVIPEEWKEPLSGEKVGFLEKVGIPWGAEGAS